MDHPAAPDGSPAGHAPRGSPALIGLWTSLALTTGLGLQRIFTTSVSVDEAYSMDTAGRSLAGTLHQAIHLELQPPLYFLALNLWLRIHRTPEFARLLSLGFVLLALLLFYRIGRRLGGDLAPALLPLLAALTAPVAWSAMTARGYSLTLLLLAACTHGFVGVWATDRPASRWDLPVFIVSGVAAMYTLYYSGFAVAGLVVGAAISGRQRRALGVAVLCMGLALLPALPAVRMQFAAHPGLAEGAATAGDRVTALPLALLFGGLFWTGMLRRALGMFALLGGLGFIGYAGARGRHPGWTRHETAWLAAAAVPVGSLMVLYLGEFSLVLARHRIVCTAALLVLLAVVVDRIGNARWRLASASVAVFVFGLFFVSFEINFEALDWRAPAALIETHASPHEPVFVFTSEGVLPLRLEYHGVNQVRGIPGDPSLETYDPTERYLRDTVQVASRIESHVAPGRSYWLIERTRLPENAGIAQLEAYLRNSTVLLGSWPLPGVNVLHLQRPDR